MVKMIVSKIRFFDCRNDRIIVGSPVGTENGSNNGRFIKKNLMTRMIDIRWFAS